MGIAHFLSLHDGEVIEFAFVDPQGKATTLHLLVDTGFIGQSSFVLPADAIDLAHSDVGLSQVVGALQGKQNRAFVSCRIDALSFQRDVMAIFADTSKLKLPNGVMGIAGLRFLRLFQRWGSEKDDHGNWRSFLEAD